MKPNILLVTTDQQRTDSLSCYGTDFTHTPHLDRLATEGVRFDRAYCTNPVCTPSRVSIFTGRHVSRHGAWNIGVHLPESERTIGDHLQTAGYRTHYVGKAHFQSYGALPAVSAESCVDFAMGQKPRNDRYPAWRGPYYGFETVELALGHTTFGFFAGHHAEWARSQGASMEFAATQRSERYFGGGAIDWDIPLRFHNSVWTADRTIEFLKQHDQSQPFLLAVGFQDPHHPHCVPLEFKDRVDPGRVPLPDYNEGELDDKPPHFRVAHCGQLEDSPWRGKYWVAGQGGGADYRTVTETDARLGRAYYYTMVKLIDQQMGRILATLDQLGLRDNTLVIFTTDHGELLGDHGLWMKGPFHYEPLVRVPLLMRWPGEFAGGRQDATVFSLVHLAPTILAAAGIAPTEMDGRDAVPLLRGETPWADADALVECIDDPGTLRLKTLVTATRKLTWYQGHDFGELYDLETDPHERVNRWDDPQYARDRAQLLSRLLAKTETLERRAPRHCYA